MPTLKIPDEEIYHDVHGSGHPLMIFAPGGLRSELAFLRRRPSNPSAPAAWIDPMKALAGEYRVVAMDQRNAGCSRTRTDASDDWHNYAGDHLALDLIGRADNRDVFHKLAQTWATGIREERREVDDRVLNRFCDNDFVFSVSREFVRQCRIPMLVMPGDDPPHPTVIGEEIAELAPDAEVLRQWKGPEHLQTTIARVTGSLDRHTPP